MRWAEKRYGCRFESTGGWPGDLISAEPPYILIEVTTQLKISLEIKARHSEQIHKALIPYIPLSKIVGIRVDSKTNKVIEFVEIDISLEK